MRPPGYAIISYLYAFIENSKALIESDFMKILKRIQQPEGIQYEEIMTILLNTFSGLKTFFEKNRKIKKN